jgi:hypothetical protein
MTVHCPMSGDSECPMQPKNERRRQMDRDDSGVNRIMGYMEERFNRMEDRMEAIARSASAQAVSIGEHGVEITTIKKKDDTRVFQLWGLFLLVVGAWIHAIFSRGAK